MLCVVMSVLFVASSIIKHHASGLRTEKAPSAEEYQRETCVLRERARCEDLDLA